MTHKEAVILSAYTGFLLVRDFSDAIRFVADKLAPKFEAEGRGTIIASGLLGGESIVGVVIAMYYAYQIIS